MTISGAEQAIVTNLDESWWEDVLEEATNELFGGDGATLELVSGRLFVGESNLTVLQLFEAPVRDSDAKDVRGEVLEGLLAGAHGFGMDYPVLAPDARIDSREESSLFQMVAKLGAEDWRESFDGHQEVFA